MKSIKIKVELSIRKPVHRVFQAVLNPKPYFVKNTNGPLRAGQTTMWEFLEMPQSFPVFGKKIVRNRQIRFAWNRGESKELNRVEFTFKRFSKNITTVCVTESGWPRSEKWRNASYMNCMGWTHMLCSLKAYLEYGVNLRHGSFVHMKF